MREKCFAKCVTKPGTSLSSGETTCISRCTDRYVDATRAISNVVLQAYSQGGGMRMTAPRRTTRGGTDRAPIRSSTGFIHNIVVHRESVRTGLDRGDPRPRPPARNPRNDPTG